MANSPVKMLRLSVRLFFSEMLDQELVSFVPLPLTESKAEVIALYEYI